MANLIDFYKEIFLHVIPVRIILFSYLTSFFVTETKEVFVMLIILVILNAASLKTQKKYFLIAKL